VPFRLDDLDELPALLSELVELPLGARLQADAEDVVLEPAGRALVAPAPLLLEARACGAVVVGLQQGHAGSVARNTARVDEIGLFPLPLVLLPGERVPLHVFEERYKELIGLCLEEEREFGLLLSDDDGQREIGTRAAVVAVLDRFDDGRMNVVVEGRERFRLVEQTSGRAYATGRVAPVDDDPAAPPDDLAAAQEALARVALLAGREQPEELAGSTAFELAARVELEPRLKQELLELPSERGRLALLTRLLGTAADRLAAARDRAEAGARNGRPATGPWTPGKQSDEPPHG
jgi:Lon protease-like protein